MTDSPLFSHEDRDLLHGVAEGIYGQVTTSSKALGDQLWNLADRIQQWLDHQAEEDAFDATIKRSVEDGSFQRVFGPVIDEAGDLPSTAWPCLLRKVDETDLSEG